MMALPIIYINSWPGAGKYTVARELEKQMDGKVRVVRNHLHIDLAGAILPRTSADYLELRHQLRFALFNTLATSPDSFDHFYVFTDFQTANEEGISVASEYEAAAKKRGCAFIPVILTCQVAENERRLRSLERLGAVEGGNGMLVDTDVLKLFRERGDVYRFQCSEQLVLNVTEITPVQAAEKIMQHVRAVCGGRGEERRKGGGGGTGSVMRG
ncbi:hypothetical protein HO173_005828 [Letharia columbiana]|uniref:Uncharacterized protein n=1 Tax=Letharia columbiana TaxID=112416 RepID=A0A8H6FWX0_9LECA|nr:uncharacterized protein HO173_005828 [Letharia columbiana]KAF6236199.1 hypothetical protein HO173_005828 [Letharia columbiana]